MKVVSVKKLVPLALALGAVVLSASGCSAVTPGPGTAVPPPSETSSAAGPTADPALLDLETKNFTQLQKRLGVAQGKVLLEDSVAVGGPHVDIQKNATVKTAGAYRSPRPAPELRTSD
jgi:hypothetical protein